MSGVQNVNLAGKDKERVMKEKECNRMENSSRCMRKMANKTCPGGRTTENPDAPCIAGPSREIPRRVSLSVDTQQMSAQ